MARSRQRILVVDDSPPAREMLGEFFASNGFDVVLARDGLAAIEHIDNGATDLVITDLEMPTLGGIAVLVHVQSRCAKVPVIVLTGYGRDDGAAHALGAGASAVLTKPVELEELLLRVRSCLK